MGKTKITYDKKKKNETSHTKIQLIKDNSTDCSRMKTTRNSKSYRYVYNLCIANITIISHLIKHERDQSFLVPGKKKIHPGPGITLPISISKT